MWFILLFNFVLHCCTNNLVQGVTSVDINATKALVWGPGLDPENITLRARYIFIQLVDKNGEKFVLHIL